MASSAQPCGPSCIAVLSRRRRRMWSPRSFSSPGGGTTRRRRTMLPWPFRIARGFLPTSGTARRAASRCTSAWPAAREVTRRVFNSRTGGRAAPDASSACWSNRETKTGAPESRSRHEAGARASRPAGRRESPRWSPQRLQAGQRRPRRSGCLDGRPSSTQQLHDPERGLRDPGCVSSISVSPSAERAFETHRHRDRAADRTLLLEAFSDGRFVADSGKIG